MRRELLTILVAVLFATGVAGCDFSSSNCESLPVQQLRVQGVSYVLGSSGNTVNPSDIGPVVGTIKDGLPDAASDCQSFTLHDGQGTPPKGTEVHSINGVDQSVSVAAKVDNQMMRFDSATPAP
ncbi:MAG: hypothetical protein RLZZ623_1005 [Actinomycetota bacterium]|jgi:hypothetical protein